MVKFISFLLVTHVLVIMVLLFFLVMVVFMGKGTVTSFSSPSYTIIM